MPRNTFFFKLFQYHQLGKETDHPILLHAQPALFFSRYWGGRQGGLQLLRNVDTCRVPYELLFKLCSWTAELAEPKGTWQSHSPGLDSHPVWCERHLSPTTHVQAMLERVLPPSASWSNLFLNDLVHYEERT